MQHPAVTIRACAPCDAEAIAAMSNLPGYRLHTSQLPFTSVEAVRRSLEGTDARMTRIVATHDDAAIGMATLRQLSGRQSHVGQVGIGVHDDWTGKGVGAALLGALVDLADQWLNLRRLQLDVLVDNAPAIALYEKFGFAREGIFHDFVFRKGEFIDALAMARLWRPPGRRVHADGEIDACP